MPISSERVGLDRNQQGQVNEGEQVVGEFGGIQLLILNNQNVGIPRVNSRNENMDEAPIIGI